MQPQPLRSRKELIFECLAGLCVGWSVWFAVSFQDFLLRNHRHSAVPTASSTNIVRCISAIVALLYIMYRSGDSWTGDFGLRRVRVSDVGYGLVFFLADFFSNFAFFAYRTGASPEHLALALQSHRSFNAWLLVYTVLSVASQELVMRSFLLNSLTKLGIKDPVAIVLGAIFFASFHLYQGVERALYLFFLALVWNTFFLWRRNVWPIFIAHLAWNTYVTFIK